MEGSSIDDVLNKYRPVLQSTTPAKSIANTVPVNVADEQAKQPESILTTNIFCNDMCAIPAHRIVSNVVKSIHAANGNSSEWGDKSKPPFYTENWDNGKATMTIGLSGSQSMQDPWESIAQMDDLMVDVMILGLTQWLYTAKTPEESIWIEIDKILDYRGIQPKSTKGYRAGHRDVDRQKILECFELLDKLYFRAYGVIDYRRNNKPQKVSVESKVLAITDRVMARDGSNIIAVKVRPGEYGKYLFGYDRRQTALLYKKILEYDYYHNQWEKRIGLYLAFQWTIRKAHGTLNQPLKVITILHNIQQQIDERYPSRTKKRLELAFNTLTNDGVISGWRYKHGADSILSKKEWLAEWLNWAICFDVPDAIVQHYQGVQQNRLKIVSRKKQGNA